MAAVAGFSLALSDWEEAAGVDSPQKKARRFRLCLFESQRKRSACLEEGAHT